MVIHWPWKNLGELVVWLKRGIYIGFFRNPFWGIYIHNPKRRYGAWSCRWCKRRVQCLVRERCHYPKTYIILDSMEVKLVS